jgi:SAM-dependent methyltransferase
MNIPDVFGKAVTDYYSSPIKWPGKITVHSSISGKEYIKVSHLFRPFKKMPELEALALEYCTGSILDIGACAGSHALELQNRGKDVTALEISEVCCSVMEKRGVFKVNCADVFHFNKGRYDTLLMLMNGIGIAGTLSGLETLLRHLKNLLNPGGKILFDSSDIDYAFYESDGSKWVDLNNNYYGQVKYEMEYRGVKGEKFDWLFIDKDKMQEIAAMCGYNFSVLADGNHYDYLGELKLKK